VVVDVAETVAAEVGVIVADGGMTEDADDVEKKSHEANLIKRLSHFVVLLV
jgi:hypothetical protein